MRIKYIIDLRNLTVGGEAKDLAKEKLLLAIIEECRLVINDGGDKSGGCQETVVYQEQEIDDLFNTTAVFSDHFDDAAAVSRILYIFSHQIFKGMDILIPDSL